jgi:hypothetical protein
VVQRANRNRLTGKGKERDRKGKMLTGKGGRAFNPKPRHPFPTLGIGASPLFRYLAGWLCSLLRIAGNGSEEIRHILHKLVVGQPKPDPRKKEEKRILLTSSPPKNFNSPLF